MLEKIAEAWMVLMAGFVMLLSTLVGIAGLWLVVILIIKLFEGAA